MFAAFAGVAVLCVGSAAAALAGVQAGRTVSPNGVCKGLPQAPSSPSTSPSPTSTPTATSSGSPSASSSGSTTITQLCISVQAVTSTVKAGQTAQFVIDVWPTGGTANNVTVHVTGQPSSLGAATFDVCGRGDGTKTCTLKTQTANQTTQLQAQISVPMNASSGTATLTGKATGATTGATTSGSVSMTASVSVIATPPTSPSPSPSPPKSHQHHHGHGHGHGSHSSGSDSDSGSGGSGLGTNLGGSLLPLTTSGGLGGAVTGTNPGSLFPTISPSPGASGSGGSPSASSSHTPYRAKNVADILPLNTRQLGSQVAGLVVLAIGVVIAVARVSLRKPRSQGK